MSETKSSKPSKVKKRHWAFILYPTKVQLDKLGSLYEGSSGYGTLPDDWYERLEQTGLQCVISPLHDKDINPTEDEKKPHWHVIISYSGPTTFNVVRTLTDSFNAPNPQALEAVRGYYRYLTHKDNPEKFQYDEKDIRTVNGFNIADFVELSKSEVSEIKRKLQTFIRQENILEYCDLLDCLLDGDMFLEHDVASSNTLFFDRYISSKRNKAGQAHRVVRVDENGEVVK